MKDKLKLAYRGIECDSEEEFYFLAWAHELMDFGYINRIERADTLELSPKISYELVEEIQLKTKVKKVIKNKTVLNPHSYTPDFIIYWNGSKFIDDGIYDDLYTVAPKYGLVEKNGVFISYIEIKPDFDQNNMTRLFKINQKFVHYVHKMYVLLLNIPGNLFQNTFTPLVYFYTLKTAKKRRIKWKARTAEEYIKFKTTK